MERMSAPYLTLMTEDAPVLATLGYPFQKRTSTMALPVPFLRLIISDRQE